MERISGKEVNMETVLRGRGRDVVISRERPTVLIGENINPTNNNTFAAALSEGRLDVLRSMARTQVEAGADVLDVNVALAGIDEAGILPEAVRIVMEAVDVPVCIDTCNIEALAGALEVHRKIAPEGKSLINSISYQCGQFRDAVSLAAEYRAAVICLTMDRKGIPKRPEDRLRMAHVIVNYLGGFGIPGQDIVIDCLALTVGSDSRAARVALNAARMVRDELDANMTLGVSNISHGMPERPVLSQAFLAMAILNGVNCPIVNVASVRKTVLAADLIMGHDSDCRRYLQGYRESRKGGSD